MATPAKPSQQLSDALVAFSLEGRFPDDISLLPPVSEIDLQPAIKALEKAKQDLETELNTIGEETKEDAGSWARNHKSLQEDITRSRSIANEIIRQSEAPEVSGEAIEEVEEKATFLAREVQYSQQLHNVLRKIQHVNSLLSEAETAKNERRILDSLRLLEKSRTKLDEVGVSKTCKVIKLLNIRSSELRSAVHEVFDHVWKALVHVDIDTHQIAVYDDIKDEQMNLVDAVLGLKQFKEVDERIEQLWHNVDAAIVSPRMNTRSHLLPKVQVQGEVLQLIGQAEQSVEALLSDLETVMVFLTRRLPSDLLPSLGKFMMADIIPRLVKEWLNSAVPSSLNEMGRFQDTIERAREFCEALEKNGYTGFGELQDWVNNAPSIWLGKCRETTLDKVRSRLLGGIGDSKQVEKVEKQMVSISEGKKISKTSEAVAPTESNDWGDAWGEEWDEDKPQASNEPKPAAKVIGSSKADEDDGADAWGGWDEEESTVQSSETKMPEKEEDPKDGDDEDDSAAAWGWGDEDTTDEPEREPAPASKPAYHQEETRELVLRETYNISSMPEPVLELISAILEDGAKLTREDNEDTSVAATAPGLFGIPTFALALFRAISPYYYSFSDGGNMFLYNDAMYLAEKLSEFSETWKKREDLSPRARNMLRLDNDIKSLQSFANRSYSSEMNIQKTILRDLVGGSQSLMQQDETKACIESGNARIRSMAAIWEPILARSVWTQAIGSLAETLATKIITDVLEMPSIGQEEAYNIANLIATATELDDLFPPKSGEGDLPRTAQFAPSWLRLKYLSEVLQSNLNEVRYLWFESELSVHFTATEVIDLIEASFEANARTRETIREIQTRPAPLAG
ncbi:hypothetical protein AK830_g7721 [Neonectria ditissima]|uniref:ZW10 C-terminal helical domain-containing protein n=1 Tax=Neonectria ditissima TaxID=78410 RepID=A0A0P7BEH8_9HYPO|nr:hypothetical protein AK830_g7721 [Neonectria ditissima]